MADAAKVNLRVNQGATFRHKLTWLTTEGVAIDMTGYTARMQARVSVENPTAIITLTTENGGINVTPLLGEVNLFISALATSQITTKKLVYDLEVQSPTGEVTRLAMGNIDVSMEVTRL